MTTNQPDNTPLDDLEAGYDKARKMSNRMGYNGDSYAAYLRHHDEELRAKGISPRPWPLSLQGNDGE